MYLQQCAVAFLVKKSNIF